MRFFDWLIGPKEKEAPRETMFLVGGALIDASKMQSVPKWTHSKGTGKLIYCPECGKGRRVFNFSWSALHCGSCSAVVTKYKWMIPAFKTVAK